jgi:hypothetical protein
MISLTLVLVASLSMAFTFTSTSSASRSSDRAILVQQNLLDTIQVLDDQPFGQLLSWNNVTRDYGDHSVTVTVNLAAVGLLVLEFTARNDLTGEVEARVATYRARAAE